ncbi:MAG: hypothetical protein ABMA14_22825 [Hyphomonadaceae bacterium]
MMDELTRKVFAGDDKELKQLIGGVAPDDESLAGFLSLIWYRAIYGSDPPAAESRPLVTKLKRTSEKATRR